MIASTSASVRASKLTVAPSPDGGMVSNVAREAFFNALMGVALKEELEKHQLAQSAKSLGILPPERVEQLLEDELQRGVAERVRDVGVLDELGEAGPGVVEGPRVDALIDAREVGAGVRHVEEPPHGPNEVGARRPAQGVAESEELSLGREPDTQELR